MISRASYIGFAIEVEIPESAAKKSPVEAGDFEVAERWATYLFQVWAAFESVDPSENGWTGRALMLRLEE